MNPADVATKLGPSDGSIFTKLEEVVPAGADKQDSPTTEAFIHLNEFQTQTDELREILGGELSSIHAGRRDDKGAEVIIAYFKGEKAKRKPLVFHLVEEQGSWLVDYFYFGSFDTEKEETLRSRKKLSGTECLRKVRSGMMEELKNGRPATRGTCAVCGTKVSRIGKG